jgi:hypothetical protein
MVSKEEKKNKKEKQRKNRADFKKEQEAKSRIITSSQKKHGKQLIVFMLALVAGISVFVFMNINK